MGTGLGRLPRGRDDGAGTSVTEADRMDREKPFGRSRGNFSRKSSALPCTRCYIR